MEHEDDSKEEKKARDSGHKDYQKKKKVNVGSTLKTEKRTDSSSSSSSSSGCKKRKKSPQRTVNEEEKEEEEEEKGEETKKKKKNRKRQRVGPLTLEDIKEERESRHTWGCYMQVDSKYSMTPYPGKTNDVVRRTTQHRRLKCKRTRRFKGDLGPYVMVGDGFLGERDSLMFEWRFGHEYKPKPKFTHAYGGKEERQKRRLVTDTIRVPALVVPTKVEVGILYAVCSMLQLTQWTKQAVPIGHEWRRDTKPFVVYWFGPDPITRGFNVTALPTAYPVHHVFNVTLDTFHARFRS